VCIPSFATLLPADRANGLILNVRDAECEYHDPVTQRVKMETDAVTRQALSGALSGQVLHHLPLVGSCLMRQTTKMLSHWFHAAHPQSLCGLAVLLSVQQASN